MDLSATKSGDYNARGNMKMKYALVTLYIANADEYVKLFHDLMGMPIFDRRPTQDGELVFLGKEGEPQIELVASPKFADAVCNGFSIGFDVDSLVDSTELMEKNGYKLLRGPISPNPAVSFSFFQGPGGVEIELIEYKGC